VLAGHSEPQIRAALPQYPIEVRRIGLRSPGTGRESHGLTEGAYVDR
jgi:hypothetical protein